MVQAPSEVTEAEAQGSIKGIFEDIKVTLRTPVVGRLFRVLATYPDYTQLAWRALKPNARTVYFERRADDLRRLAVEAIQTLRLEQMAAPSDAQQVVHVFQYVNPKMFLATAALHSATNGQQPKLTDIPSSEKRQIMPGVPPEMQMKVPPAGDASTEPASRTILDDISRTLGLDGDDDLYAALASWPDYLGKSWSIWKGMLATPEYRRIQRAIYRTAEDAVTALPYRMEIYPHALRHGGLSETQIDGVRATLSSFYGAGATLVGYTALLSSGLGGEATASPFSPVSR